MSPFVPRRFPVSTFTVAAVLLWLVGGSRGLIQAPVTPVSADQGAADDEGEEGEESDSAEVAIGERLFLETRFAQFFFARSAGDANAVLASGDPVMDATETTGAPLPGPFAGASMNCRACHLVDEQSGLAGGGNRTYADFAARSPLPAREDGLTVTARNSPPLVNASLPRRPFLQHFDGEFTSMKQLVIETLMGRNYGWLPRERRQALAHIAHIIRADDGSGALAQEFGGAYRVLLAGTDPAIPPSLLLPRRFRIDVLRESDEKVVRAIAGLVAKYVESLVFAQDEKRAFVGSPYDAFLRLNDLPRRPARGESDRAYSRRLRALLARLAAPRFVTPEDGELRLHSQAFAFGAVELEGLKIFLRETRALPLSAEAVARGGVGNCVACHPAPSFTDFKFHNTGAAQSEYDAIHGAGAFAALSIPGYFTRRRDHDAYLPPTAKHPDARGTFRAVPSIERPGLTDLGLWNIFANPDFPGPQPALRQLLCEEAEGICAPSALLPTTIARFKTPGLRDLGHSSPYLHTGRANTLEEVLRLYAEFASLARAGHMLNPAPELRGMALVPADGVPLGAFLRSLNEDYE